MASNKGGIKASVEDHANLQGAEAAGAHSCAHIMLTGHLAPLPAELVAGTCAGKLLSGEWTRQCSRPVEVYAWAVPPARHSNIAQAMSSESAASLFDDGRVKACISGALIA